MAHRKSDDLPGELALFPLRGAVLLPRTRLPLNIFEPRYLAMVDYAMSHRRLIGMVRPTSEDAVNPPLYEVGCAGRITNFSESGDGRYLIELTGVSRFRIRDEAPTDRGFRLGEVDWRGYGADLQEAPDECPAMRERLIDLLLRYLDQVGLTADMDTIEGASAETIVNSVAMTCPFEADEKQALLEAPSLSERANTLVALMEIALAEHGAGAYDPQDRFQ